MKFGIRRFFDAAWLPAVALSLASCTGGAGSTDTTGSVAAHEFTVGGTVSGLGGTGLVLQDNVGDDLTVTASGAFTFPTKYITGDSYTVSVLTQPSTPNQTCVVGSASGTVGGADVTGIAVTCTGKTTATDTIGGTAVGVLGGGLVLQNNGSDNLAIASDGTFTFATPLTAGVSYDVSIFSPPINPYQNCVVVNGAGVTGASNITNVSVSCKTNVSPAYTIGGTVTGVSGTAPVTLLDNGRDKLTVTADGPFTFALPIPSGSTYDVTALPVGGQQSQTCTFTNASGTVAGSNITNVSIACKANALIKLNVTGLSGSGLPGSAVVLQNSDGDTLTVTQNGTVAFATALASGAAYDVAVITQPSNPVEVCTVAGGVGTVTPGSATVIAVTCANKGYTVSGTISGLDGAGLVLQDNGGNNLAVTKNGAFIFTQPVASGSKFLVSVFANPANVSQTCQVTSGGAGTIGDADITGVQVQCTTNSYTVGGTVSGLAGTPLVLVDNGGNALTIAANGPFNFSIPLESGMTYAVRTQTQPTNPYQTCMVTAGGGTVGGGDVTSVRVQCTTNTYTVGGTVSGLAGSGLMLLDNLGNARAIAANGAFTFSAPVASGSTYSVSIGTQPSTPTQTCTVTANGSGPITNAKVTNVAVACVTNNYTLSINVSVVAPGSLASGLAVADNFGAALPVPGAALQPGTYQLDTLPSGSNYIVTITQQPSAGGNFCAVANGTGTVTDAAVTNIDVECITPYNYLYVTNRTGNDISGFAIDNYTSTLMPVTAVIAPTGQPNAIAAALPMGDIEPTAAVGGCILNVSQTLGYSPISLYIANSGSTTISNFQVNTLTGALTFLNDSTTTGSPIFLDYYNNENAGCLLLGLNIVPPGATGYTTDANTGALTPAAGNPYAAPDNSDSNAASLATFQNGQTPTTDQFVLGIDQVLMGSELWVYPVDTGTAELGPVSNEFPMPAGSDAIGTNTLLTPGSLTYPFIYVASQLASTISVYEYQATNDLVAVQAGVATGPGPTAMAFVSNSNELQTGNASPLLYVANGDGTISAYSVQTSASTTTGQLTPIAIPAVPHGTAPAAMASEFAGDMGPFLYVVNSTSNDIYVYKVNLTAPGQGQPLPVGALTFVGNYSTGRGPSAIGIVSFVDQ